MDKATIPSASPYGVLQSILLNPARKPTEETRVTLMYQKEIYVLKGQLEEEEQILPARQRYHWQARTVYYKYYFRTYDDKSTAKTHMTLLYQKYIPASRNTLRVKGNS